jgi:hopanoid biosynthesis associated protein HpnK
MVAAPAAADAVARAKRMPTLRVGLHIVLVEGRPALPTYRIPVLVDRDGNLRRDMARLGLQIAMRPSVRRQIANEIEAQFARFRETGLPLDHVNAHKHFHLHPAIARLIITIGRDYGLRALRVPREPGRVLMRIEPPPGGRLRARIRRPRDIIAPFAAALGGLSRRAGLHTPDAVFGLRWSGAMTPARMSGILRNLPPGLVEIYTHPGTRDDFPGHAPGYRYGEELAALTHPESKEALAWSQYRLGGFSDFAA